MKRHQTKLERTLRRAMRALGLDHVTWEERPTYPHAYRWTPPGKLYTRHHLHTTPTGIRHSTEDLISHDKRAHGLTVFVVHGVPPAAGEPDNDRARAILTWKVKIASLGYSVLA